MPFVLIASSLPASTSRPLGVSRKRCAPKDAAAGTSGGKRGRAPLANSSIGLVPLASRARTRQNDQSPMNARSSRVCTATKISAGARAPSATPANAAHLLLAQPTQHSVSIFLDADHRQPLRFQWLVVVPGQNLTELELIVQ